MTAFGTRVGAALGISCMIALATGCGGSQKDVKSASSAGGGSQGPAEVGKAAPDLSIHTLNGKGDIKLSELSGKVVIVDFWATWCGPCKESFPKYEELSKKHSGVVVIGVSVDDDKNDIPDFVKQRGATFPIGWDEGHSIANRWKVDTMPTAFIVDATGTVRHVHAGFHDDEPATIDKELAALEGESGSSSSAKTAVASADPPKDAKDAKDSKDSASSSDSSSSDAADAPPPPPPPKKTTKPKGKGGKKAPAKKKKQPSSSAA